MDLMEPVKLDLNRSRACSRCAFCAFLRLCLSSYLVGMLAKPGPFLVPGWRWRAFNDTGFSRLQHVCPLLKARRIGPALDELFHQRPRFFYRPFANKLTYRCSEKD
jgi:hypothetical protein